MTVAVKDERTLSESSFPMKGGTKRGESLRDESRGDGKNEDEGAQQNKTSRGVKNGKVAVRRRRMKEDSKAE